MKLSTRFYLASVGLGWGFPLSLITIEMGEDVWRELLPALSDPTVEFVFLVEIPSAYAAGVMLTLWYRMWTVVQDGHARTTPGQAIGLLFLPILNFFWIFQVLVGWVEDYNGHAVRSSLSVPKLGKGLFFAYPILSLLTIFVVALTATTAPALGLMILWAAFVVALVLVFKICKAVNALSSTTTRSGDEAASQSVKMDP